MSELLNELRKTGVFYVATVDEDGQPHVRPFGAAAEFEGKVYLCTNNTKACYKQMIAEPRVEISGMQPDGTWLRLTAKLVRDDRDEAKEAMLRQNESLRGMYRVGDGIFEVLALTDVSCVKCSFTAPPVVIE